MHLVSMSGCATFRKESAISARRGHLCSVKASVQPGHEEASLSTDIDYSDTRKRPSKGYYSLMNHGKIVPRGLPMLCEVS